MKAKVNLINILSYLVGNYRYWLMGSEFQWLIRSHIYEQIQWRISVMDRNCYADGSCFICGCPTTKLQMAKRSCDKPCYPTMMNKKQWGTFKLGGIVFDPRTMNMWQEVNGNLIKFFNNKERQNELDKNTH
jgi:hypothetical protein